MSLEEERTMLDHVCKALAALGIESGHGPTATVGGYFNLALTPAAGVALIEACGELRDLRAGSPAAARPAGVEIEVVKVLVDALVTIAKERIRHGAALPVAAPLPAYVPPDPSQPPPRGFVHRHARPSGPSLAACVESATVALCFGSDGKRWIDLCLESGPGGSTTTAYALPSNIARQVGTALINNADR